MKSLSSHHSIAISETVLCTIQKGKRKSFRSSSQDMSQQQWGVFSSIFMAQMQEAWGEWCILYSQQWRTQNQPTEAFYSLLDQKKNNEHKSNEIRDPQTDMFPKIHVGLSQHKRLTNTRSVEINVFFTHILKVSSVFFPLCDYLFICLLIYFSLLQVQRACVWCAPMAVFTKGEEGCCCCLQVKGRRCLLICSCIVKASD